MSRPDQPLDAQAAAAALKAAVAAELRAGLRLSAGKAARPPEPEPETLESIRADLGACTRCSLCDKRTEIVFGAGSPRSRLVFVGAAPSAADDAAGRPFCGEDGELLTRIIESIKRTRRDVYLTHVVKCAPGGGRLALPEEVDTCLPFLWRQLASIGPAVVCALGQAAAQSLLAADQPLEQLRGRFHACRGFLVMPTHDPVFLIQNPGRKRETWNDMKMIMAELVRAGA